MNCKDIQKTVNQLCEKHNINKDLFIAGYTNTHNEGRIKCHFGNRKDFNPKKQKFAVIYYNTDNLYLVFKIDKEKSAKSVFSIKYSDYEDSIAKGYNYAKKFIEFRGKHTEKVAFLNFEQLEDFIKTQAE